MGIFKRVNDIISANLNELVASFEEPEKMLKQAIREMESALNKAMDGAAKVIANEKRLAKQLSDWRTQAGEWKNRAEQAIARNDDAAARQALVRKRECEQLIAALDDQRTAAGESARKLKRQIEAMRVRLAEARRKALTLTARKRAVDARKTFLAEMSSASVDQSAFGRFDRICESIEQSEAEADALLELTGDALDDSFDLGAFPEIETELAEMNHELHLAEKSKTNG